MGKYDRVIHALPRMLGAEPEYQEKVEAVKTAMIQDREFRRHASWLAREYAAIRKEKGEAEAALKEINLRLEAVSQLMFSQFEAEGIERLDVDGRSVSVRLEPYASVADRETFRQWCESDSDLRRLMTLPWATVNKLTKDRLLAGEAEPPGVVLYAKQRFTLGSE